VPAGVPAGPPPLAPNVTPGTPYGPAQAGPYGPGTPYGPYGPYGAGQPAGVPSLAWAPGAAAFGPSTAQPAGPLMPIAPPTAGPVAPIAGPPVAPPAAWPIAPNVASGVPNAPNVTSGTPYGAGSGTPYGAEPGTPYGVGPGPGAPAGWAPGTAPGTPMVGAVPPAAVGAFQRLTGVDLGFVPLVRGPEVGRTAAELNARAYTSGGVVHLPAGAGPPDRVDNEALLAHELAHVAQQRALGTDASEAGVHGGELEAIARGVEAAARGEGQNGQNDQRPGQNGQEDLLGSLAGAGLTWLPSTGFTPGPQPAGSESAQRADQDTSSYVSEVLGVPAPEPEVSPALEAPYPDDGGEDGTNGRAVAGSPEELAELLAASDLRDRVQAFGLPVPGGLLGPGVLRAALAADRDAMDLIAARVAATLHRRFVAINDPADLDALASRLYERLRGRLRDELLVDRERGGLLSEFR
jgi:hypothetical protein